MSKGDVGVLRLLVGEAAELTGLRSGRIYVQDRRGLRIRATLGYDSGPARWPERIEHCPELDDALSGKLVVRVTADDIVMATLQPRGRQGLLMVGLMAAHRKLIGVILLEDESGVEIDQTMLSFAATAGMVTSEWAAKHELSMRLEDLNQRQRSLQAEASVERSFSRLVAGPGGVAAMVKRCAELTGKVAAVYANDHRLISTVGPQERAKVSLPSLSSLLTASGPVPPGEPTVVAARPLAGLARPHLLSSVVSDGESYGWLVLAEHPFRFRPFDLLVVRLASQYVARELAVQRRVADVAWSARSSLARQLIKGTNDLDDLRTSGEYLGVNIDARRVLVYAVGPAVHEAPLTEIQAFGDDLSRRLGLEVLVTRGSEGIMLLIEAAADATSADFVATVKATLRNPRPTVLGWNLTAGVSSVCEPQGLARAYREAREVAHCIDRFASPAAARILAVDDLGPARLFVANSAVAAVRAYVDDVLGVLLTGEPGTADLIATLGRYFDSGRSVRVSAAQLGIHENTVRLRLARISAATGLDLAANANDQLSAQTALLVLRLQRHPALPSFDDDVSADAVRSA
jgi:sugar diacid utilization regulator